ncbi:MAG: hypothetical protein JWL59_4197 [Chthoniobacteraceae bacterium]|nr:hypothetical protein [Chthoniobacteraceae bacterium]
MKQTLSITIWRESVCAGDDCDAPHELCLLLPHDISLGDVAERILGARYLASITGGKATWILDAQRPLAVFAQQWTQPRFLVSPDTPLASLFDHAAKPHLQFRYWCQADPERVFHSLEHGEALPERYSR